MLRLIALVLSIGLADSLNPSTLAPALYLATGEHAVRDLIQFTLGVVGVYLLGGLLLVIGPGAAILALVPHPHATARYVLETSAGVVMLVAGFLLWTHRYRLAKPRDDDDEKRKELVDEIAPDPDWIPGHHRSSAQAASACLARLQSACRGAHPRL